MESDYYTIEGFYMDKETVNEINTMLYSMSGVINVRNYFDGNSNRVPIKDPGAEASNLLLNQLRTNINDLYKKIDNDLFNQEFTQENILYLAIDPNIKYLLSEKFNAIKTLEDCDIQTAQSLVFKQSVVSDDIYELKQIY